MELTPKNITDLGWHEVTGLGHESYSIGYSGVSKTPAFLLERREQGITQIYEYKAKMGWGIAACKPIFDGILRTKEDLELIMKLTLITKP